MVQLEGKNLGERHRDFNLKVKQATQSAVKLNEIEADNEIKTLYKIDIASEYKDIDYLIDILKSGDSLYTTRVLKKTSCIYEDQFSHIINPLHLRQTVFTMVPLRMKTKILTEIAINLKNEMRAEDFYKYCVETKNMNIGFKFLRKTSFTFKRKVLETSETKIISEMMICNENHFRHFLNGSFDLLNIIIEKELVRVDLNFLLDLSYMFSSSNTKYLDLLESSVKLETLRPKYYVRTPKLGRDLSKIIMKKHKQRVLSNPILYIHILNEKSIIRYTTAEEAKLYLKVLLPEKLEEFWSSNFFNTYNYLANLIDLEERFQYAKTIFIHKYPNEEFEMNVEFYHKKYHNLMTMTQKETWALENLTKNKELLGCNNDYIWCQFINYDQALPIVKKYIMNTTDRTERSKILLILVKTIRNQGDIIKLCDYYYDRFVNELAYLKESFLRSIINKNNIYEFENQTWTSFNKLLRSLDIYNKSSTCDNNLVAMTIMYHIVKKLEVPKVLIEILKYSKMYKFIPELDKISDNEERTIFYDFCYNLFTNEISHLLKECDYPTEESKDQIINLIEEMAALLKYFKKSRNYIPAVVLEFVNSNPSFFENDDFFTMASKEKKVSIYVKIFKNDATNIIKNFNEVKECLKSHEPRHHKKILKALRPYFMDLSEEYLKLLSSLIQDENSDVNLINSTVFAFFTLYDTNSLLKFMYKFAPEISKIKHDQMVTEQQKLKLNIQKAICKFACFSRPPIPKDYILKYLKGDFVQFCLPLFSVYIATLPPSALTSFVESILDQPVSIQKHGLSLAFHCFDVENISNVLSNAWKKTKNPSIREILFNKLFNHILDKSEDEQNKLFELLLFFVRDLNEDTDKSILNNIQCGRLPDRLIGAFLESLWNVVSQFPNRPINISYKCNILHQMGNNILLIKKDVINLIINQFLKLIDEPYSRIGCNDYETQLLQDAQWNIVKVYINELKYDEGTFSLVKNITHKCIKLWGNVCDEIYNVRKFFFDFIAEIKYNNYKLNAKLITIIESNLNEFEVYNMLWEIKLSSICLKVNEKYNKENIPDSIKCIKSLQDYAVAVGLVINDYIINNKYCSSFNSDLKNIITDNVEYISVKLSKTYCSVSLTNKYYVIVCQKLSDLNIKEVYDVILKMLPLEEVEDCPDEYAHIVQKIFAFDDLDIKYQFHKKFISDGKRRKYVPT